MVVLICSLVCLKQPVELTIKHIHVMLLQTLIVSIVDFIEKPLITHELCVFKVVHQLLEVELEVIFFPLFFGPLNILNEFGLLSLHFTLKLLHLERSTLQLFHVFSFIFIVMDFWIFLTEFNDIIVINFWHRRF